MENTIDNFEEINEYFSDDFDEENNLFEIIDKRKNKHCDFNKLYHTVLAASTHANNPNFDLDLSNIDYCDLSLEEKVLVSILFAQFDIHGYYYVRWINCPNEKNIILLDKYNDDELREFIINCAGSVKLKKKN